MNKLITIATAALSLACVTSAIAQPYYGGGTPIYEQNGTYRGNINASPYEANSMNNPYGRYGSSYSPDSFNNPYGAGNPYRSANPYGR